MKHLLVLALLCVSAPALADHDVLFTLTSAATADVNDSTELLSPGAKYDFQCSGPVYYRTCETSSCAAVATDTQVDGDGKKLFPIDPRERRRYVSILSASGASETCKVIGVVTP